jgi:hypothetical protein
MTFRELEGKAQSAYWLKQVLKWSIFKMNPDSVHGPAWFRNVKKVLVKK